MKKRYQGKLVSGFGSATLIMKKLLEEYHQQLDPQVVPGTINLELPEDFEMPVNSIAIDWGSQKFYYYPIELFKKKAYVMRPERHPFSKNVVEIIATEHICSTYDLKYGDIIEFEMK